MNRVYAERGSGRPASVLREAVVRQQRQSLDSKRIWAAGHERKFVEASHIQVFKYSLGDHIQKGGCSKLGLDAGDTVF